MKKQDTETYKLMMSPKIKEYIKKKLVLNLTSLIKRELAKEVRISFRYFIIYPRYKMREMQQFRKNRAKKYFKMLEMIKKKNE